MMSLVLKKLSIIAGIFIFSYLILCLSLRVWQNRLIFYPDIIIRNTPSDFGLDYEDINLEVDRSKLHSWWLPARNSQKVLIYLHGNSTNISGANLRHAVRFHSLGFSVLMVDYRGYGQSTGDFPTEKSVYKDAISAWDYLTKKRGIKAENIFIYGHSLGGAIAIELAVNRPQAAGLIVEGSFTSIRQMAEYDKVFRLLPLDWIVTQKFDSIAKIDRLQTPLLIVHAKEDETIPSFMGETLYNKAKVPKQIWLVPNAGHNNIGDITGDRYLQTIRDFLQKIDRETSKKM